MIQKIEHDMRQFLKKNSDPAIVRKYSRYFREGYDPYGVPFEKLTPKVNEWFNTYQKELTRKELLTLCDHLLSSGKHEEASIAIGFIFKLRDKYDKGLFNAVGR